MDELERWLVPLGLAQLAPVLRANDVDLEILSALNEADLEKLGLSLGQRKKLMKAAASLPHPWSSGASNAAGAPSLSVASSAERRQLTVMFCDLVGSTALASRLDPEDLREVIGGYHRCVAATVARFDGFVAKYMGDGVLLYFGYPQAHEDDAERAVRAGLALVEAVGRLQASEQLRVRVGIATGLAVVGDLIGTGAAQEPAVVGETPNLAGRLRSTAHLPSPRDPAGPSRLQSFLNSPQCSAPEPLCSLRHGATSEERLYGELFFLLVTRERRQAQGLSITRQGQQPPRRNKEP